MEITSHVAWLSALPLQLLLTGTLLAALALVFMGLFFIPGAVYWVRLWLIQRRLSRLPTKSSPDEFRKLFSKDRLLSHLWSEFAETLHSQSAERDGVIEIVAVRATVPSETFFSTQYVVDSRLRTEFFKHFPGVFTGLGIIGTFSGLIDGLQNFKVSEDASSVRQSLEGLMHAVGEAFLISAAAIATAMLVTLLEKLLLASLYRRTEEIAHRIDANFDAGAGEEYLSRLVNASEASASQSKILKDSLVRELGDILRQLTEAQLKAAREEREVLAHNIAGCIEQSLKSPLDRIASIVEKSTGDQSASAVQMLNDVMVSFSQRLNDLFGGQIKGINELSSQNAQAMRESVAALQTLIGKLEESGRRSTDEMAAKMLEAIKTMETRQTSINDQTFDFVRQIKEIVGTSQSDTQSALREALESVAQQMQSILSSLAASQTTALADQHEREKSMTDRAAGFVGEITKSVEAAIEEMSASARAVAFSVQALSTATTSTVDKMNVGATRLSTAATSFAEAGERVTGTMTQAVLLGEKLTTLTGQMSGSSSALQDVLRDYQAQRLAISSLFTEARSIVELARKEASLTADVLQRLEASTSKLSQAQKSADLYLEGVNKVLTESNDAFRDAVVSTLGKVNHEFHAKLTDAVGLLSGTVQELEVTLGSLAPRR